MGISTLKPQGGGTNFENYNHSIAKATSFNASTPTNVLSVTGEGILTSATIGEISNSSADLTMTITVDGATLPNIKLSEYSASLALMIPFKQNLLVQGIGSGVGSIHVSYGLKK